MNIEDSIRELKGYLTWLEANGFSKLAKDSAIETLLTAYEKEKEKNKELEELKEENKKYIVQLTDEQYRKLVDIIRSEISKEWEYKIKAKIEEVSDGIYDAKIVLQSLLEKEE